MWIPFSFMAGLDALIPIEFGTLYVIVNVVLLLFSLIADRHNIGIATFINLFLLGYITLFTHELLRQWIPDPSLPVRCICPCIGIIITAFFMRPLIDFFNEKVARPMLGNSSMV